MVFSKVHKTWSANATLTVINNGVKILMKYLKIWMVKDPVTHQTGSVVVYTTTLLTTEQTEQKVFDLVKYINPQIKVGEYGWEFITLIELV